MAERLDRQWSELRGHVTIEKDLEKMLRLTAELDRRSRQVEAVDSAKCRDNA